MRKPVNVVGNVGPGDVPEFHTDNDGIGGAADGEPRVPNGFTKFIRRILSVLCAIAFFGLITLDYVVGVAAKEIPVWLYALLFSGAAAGWGPIFRILAMLTNPRSK